jgi:serine/threonine-protein kinase
VGPRSDVFSLGAILFEILALQSLRKSHTMAGIIEEINAGRGGRPSERGADVAAELDELCQRALSRAPGERGTALEMAEGIEGYLEGDRARQARAVRARGLIASVNERLSGPSVDPQETIEAMRDGIQALALAPRDQEAQRMLLSLFVSAGGELPPAAAQEYEQTSIPAKIEGLRYGLAGVFLWLTSIPLAAALGVRSWPVVLVTSVLLLGCFAYMWGRHQAVQKNHAMYYRHPLGLAVGLGAVIALTSSWLGPFVLTPLAGAAALVFFLLLTAEGAKRWAIAISSAAVAVPFAVELLGVVPPAFTFEGSDIVLHARALALPEVPTLAVFVCQTGFLVLTASFIGRLVDRKQARDRQSFVQGWYLRQLFRG